MGDRRISVREVLRKDDEHCIHQESVFSIMYPYENGFTPYDTGSKAV